MKRGDKLEWFLGFLLRALQGAEVILSAVPAKARFWQRWTGSPDSALRDITDLVDRGVLVKSGAGGRSTCYDLKSLD